MKLKEIYNICNKYDFSNLDICSKEDAIKIAKEHEQDFYNIAVKTIKIKLGQYLIYQILT